MASIVNASSVSGAADVGGSLLAPSAAVGTSPRSLTVVPLGAVLLGASDGALLAVSLSFVTIRPRGLAPLPSVNIPTPAG